MQIMHVNLVLHRGVTKIVGRSKRLPTFHPAAGHPARETARIVVPAFSILAG
jgi:hypothetical protein